MIPKTKLKISAKMLIDILSIYVSYLFSLLIIFDLRWRSLYSNNIMILMLVYFLIMFKLKIYKKTWRYISMYDIYETIVVLGISELISLFLFLLFKRQFIFKIYLSLTPLSILFSLGIRFIVKEIYNKRKISDNGEKLNTLLIGAGDTGEHLIRETFKNKNFNYKIVGLIDDDEKKIGMILCGYKILGDRYDIENIVEEYNIEVIILAIPSATQKDFRDIDSISKNTGAEGKILPTFNELLNNKLYINQLREVRVEDLLGRDVIAINTKNIRKLIENKIVLVTGGAGSIGSELSRQIAEYNPKQMIILDINENSLYFLELELKRKRPNLNISIEMCNIREKDKLEYVFNMYKPNIVFHAAAHKHVPLMEHNPEEAVKNNIFGSKNVIDLSDKYNIEKFVLISTDKAVNPTNIMGTTKRVAEILIEDKNKNSKTKFVAVRFGNVLGSNGSVIPIFKKLIEERRNLTITHPEITRYFMTIPEASQLVLEAAYLGKGGEVFILDMGEPVKIIDLAKNLIELSGLKLGKDIEIEITGLRPGEKLYEELLYNPKTALKTENKKIFIAQLCEEKVDIDYFLEKLSQSIRANDFNGIKMILMKFIKTYKEPNYDNN